MLMRTDPFRELERLIQQPSVAHHRSSLMPLDAYRHGDEFIVNFDLPGVDSESVEITVDKNVLEVSAERNWSPEQDDEILIAERPQGSYKRQLFLGDALSTSDIEANMDRGVLSVRIPISESAKPRRVTLNDRSQSKPIDATSSRTK